MGTSASRRSPCTRGSTMTRWTEMHTWPALMYPSGRDGFGRSLDVRVGKDHNRARRAQVQGQLPHPGGARDVFADRRGAGEGDLADPGVGDQGVTELLASAVAVVGNAALGPLLAATAAAAAASPAASASSASRGPHRRPDVRQRGDRGKRWVARGLVGELCQSGCAGAWRAGLRRPVRHRPNAAAGRSPRRRQG
jgi:hypothetical protein